MGEDREKTDDRGGWKPDGVTGILFYLVRCRKGDIGREGNGEEKKKEGVYVVAVKRRAC